MVKTGCKEQLAAMEGFLQGLQVMARDKAIDHAAMLAGAASTLDEMLGDLRVALDRQEQQQSELHAARAALECERQRYWELFNLAPDAYLVTDGAGRILEANQAAGRLLHRPPAQLVGLALSDLAAQNEHASLCARLSNLASLVQVNEWELCLLPDQAAPVMVGARVSVDCDKQGRVLGLRWLLRDITEQRQTQGLLAALVESCHTGIISTDRLGQVRSWNQAAEEIFGYSAEEIMGRSIDLLAPPDGSPEPRSLLEHVLQGQRIDQLKTVRQRKDGQRITIALSIWPIYNGHDTVVGASAIVRDIGEEQRAEDERSFLIEASTLLSSSLDYETTLRHLGALVLPRLADWYAVAIQAEDGSYNWLEIAHRDPQKVALARELLSRYPPTGDAAHGAMAVIRTGKAELYPTISEELLAASAHDAEHLQLLQRLNMVSSLVVPLHSCGAVLGAIVLVAAESGRQYGQRDLQLAEELARRVALAIDHARLFKQAQTLNTELEQRVQQRTAELRALSRKLLSVQENERRHLARELHDEVAQTLTALQFALSMLVPVAGQHQHIERARGIIKDLMGQVRDLSLTLRPSTLDHLGLLPALEWLIGRYTARTNIQVKFRPAGTPRRFGFEVETAAYRIVQEALTNAARYAGVDRVEVHVQVTDRQLGIVVNDLGAGFNPERVRAENRASGLTSMAERAALVGGQLLIEAAPGTGTRILATLPLD